MPTMFAIQIKLSPTSEFSFYRGWDTEYSTRWDATKARKRALAVGYYSVRVVQLGVR